MIIGIGVDVVEIARIEKLQAEFGDRFLNRIYSKSEQAKAAASANPSKIFASRFAAKEAGAKAIGHAIRDGILFRDFEVTNDQKGRPELLLHGMAKHHLISKIPIGYVPKLDLSISEDANIAIAFVVISAEQQK